MTNHERRMSERDWGVGDEVMVACETWDGETEWRHAEVVDCECETWDAFTVVFDDGETERVAGCEVMSMAEAAQTV